MQKYRHLLSIPEGNIEEFSIIKQQFPPGHVFELANRRAQLMGGQKNKVVSWEDVTTVHTLKYPGGQMAELPCEIKQHADCLKPIKRGRVLVGGLGIGLTETILPPACDITVVEISPEVIKLVGPSVKRDVCIINDDLLKWLKNTKEKFDYAFFDTWASDGEGTFFDTVVPLLKLSHRRITTRPICWNEDVMRGQLYFSIHTGLSMALAKIEKAPTLEELATPKGNHWWDWKVPFYRRVLAKEWTERDIPIYVQIYGDPVNEKLWSL